MGIQLMQSEMSFDFGLYVVGNRGMMFVHTKAPESFYIAKNGCYIIVAFILFESRLDS